MGRIAPEDLRILAELEKKVLWLASWTIHHANHVRANVDGVKVGGHQASSASLATIMTALYFHVLRPQDRVAVKPHASPNASRRPCSPRSRRTTSARTAGGSKRRRAG